MFDVCSEENMIIQASKEANILFSHLFVRKKSQSALAGGGRPHTCPSSRNVVIGAGALFLCLLKGPASSFCVGDDGLEVA
jgi:hypothetical protein